MFPHVVTHCESEEYYPFRKGVSYFSVRLCVPRSRVSRRSLGLFDHRHMCIGFLCQSFRVSLSGAPTYR